MKEIRFLISLLLIILPFQHLKSEIIIMSKCDDKQDEFLKNEYILNLDELIMTRNYVYKEKTYQKYRLTDLSTVLNDEEGISKISFCKKIEKFKKES